MFWQSLRPRGGPSSSSRGHPGAGAASGAHRAFGATLGGSRRALHRLIGPPCSRRHRAPGPPPRRWDRRPAGSRKRVRRGLLRGAIMAGTSVSLSAERTMVLYAVIAGAVRGELFMAGFIPGAHGARSHRVPISWRKGHPQVGEPRLGGKWAPSGCHIPAPVIILGGIFRPLRRGGRYRLDYLPGGLLRLQVR